MIRTPSANRISSPSHDGPPAALPRSAGNSGEEAAAGKNKCRPTSGGTVQKVACCSQGSTSTGRAFRSPIDSHYGAIGNQSLGRRPWRPLWGAWSHACGADDSTLHGRERDTLLGAVLLGKGAPRRLTERALLARPPIRQTVVENTSDDRSRSRSLSNRLSSRRPSRPIGPVASERAIGAGSNDERLTPGQLLEGAPVCSTRSCPRVH